MPEIPEWLHEQYPFVTRTLQVDGQAISFVDEGPSDQRIYVLLHGSPTWSFAFRHVIARLSNGARVIAPDHVGFGLSSKPADASYHTLPRHIANFTALMDTLKIERATLVLNGWGGPIGLGFAVSHPERVERLVLVNTWGTALPNVSPRRTKAGIFSSVFGSSFFGSAATRAVAAQSARKVSDMVLEAYKFPLQHGADIAVPCFSNMLFTPDAATRAALKEIEAGLRKVTAPADILHGLRDPVLTKLSAYLLRDALKAAREPVFLPNASHLVPEDDPDALLAMIMRQDKRKAEAARESVFKILT